MKIVKVVSISLIALSMIFLGACGGDDDDDKLCATCFDDAGEEELCAETQSALDDKIDNWLVLQWDRLLACNSNNVFI